MTAAETATNPIVWIVGAVIVIGAVKGLHNAVVGRKLPELLIVLAMVGLLVFGVGWEAAECVSGRHFGDPGNGSNPLDTLCPFDKTSGSTAVGEGSR